MNLGLSDAEFWRLTPRELFLLWDRHRERLEERRYLAGLVCATFANFNGMAKPGRQLTPADFVPLKNANPGDEPSEEELAQRIEAAFSTL